LLAALRKEAAHSPAKVSPTKPMYEWTNEKEAFSLYNSKDIVYS
jgi:hypothetical protein